MSKLPSRKKSFDVVGESRPSRDGTSRQLLLLQCEPGDPIALERQPDNEYDPNAILVVWEGHDLGFLAKEDAAAIAPSLDQGRAYKANIHKLTGGSADYPSYGLKVAVAWDDAPLPGARPLTAAQLASRRGKIAVQGRERDTKGAFKRRSDDRNRGCLGVAWDGSSGCLAVVRAALS